MRERRQFDNGRADIVDVKCFGKTLGSDVHNDIGGPTNPVSGNKARTDGTGKQLSYVFFDQRKRLSSAESFRFLLAVVGAAMDRGVTWYGRR